MEIRVWQRNDKDRLDYPDYSALDSFFYTILSLPLTVGETVPLNDLYTSPVVFEIVYDGDITGSYDIPARNIVAYTGKTEQVPVPGGGDSVRTEDDATFRGNRVVTLGIKDDFSALQKSLDSTVTGKTKSDATANVAYREQTYGFNYKNFYRSERFFEVYPDSPEIQETYANLKNKKRLVITNYLTVQAMHPTKPNTPIAKAVLEITKYSHWFGSNLSKAEIEYAMERCDLNECHGKITVVSYEQSDSFSME